MLQIKEIGWSRLFLNGLPLRIVMIGTLTGAQWGEELHLICMYMSAGGATFGWDLALHIRCRRMVPEAQSALPQASTIRGKCGRGCRRLAATDHLYDEIQRWNSSNCRI